MSATLCFACKRPAGHTLLGACQQNGTRENTLLVNCDGCGPYRLEWPFHETHQWTDRERTALRAELIKRKTNNPENGIPFVVTRDSLMDIAARSKLPR